MSFRGTLQPQKDLLLDQKLLQQAQDTGGAGGVAAAMAKLKDEAMPQKEVVDVDVEPEQPDGWEWSLCVWPVDGGESYELKTVPIGATYANELLNEDVIFQRYIVDAPISPTHLTTTGSALSSKDDAINCQKAVCPRITDWLTGDRKGQWVCAGTSNGTCEHQHECKGGKECDVELCHLLHPTEESRWIVCANKTQHWVLAMNMDEAIHYAGTGKIAALAAGDETCTRADVWRASVQAVAYGRKKIAAADKGAPAEQTITPAAAATAQTAPPGAATQTALPDAQQQLAATAQEKSDQAAAAKRKRKAEEAALAKPPAQAQTKRVKQGESTNKLPAAQLAGSGRDKDSAGEGGNNAKPADEASGKGSGHAAMQPGERNDDDCLHFIRLTKEYITEDMSKAYKSSVTRAAKLTPAERAALLGSLASMI